MPKWNWKFTNLFHVLFIFHLDLHIEAKNGEEIILDSFCWVGGSYTVQSNRKWQIAFKGFANLQQQQKYGEEK